MTIGRFQFIEYFRIGVSSFRAALVYVSEQTTPEDVDVCEESEIDVVESVVVDST